MKKIMKDLVYRRVVLKISGEALSGGQGYGIDPSFLATLAGEIEEAVSLGAQMALVVGGGNIFRGVEGVADGMDRVTADAMGMLATIINSLAVQSELEKRSVPAAVMSAIAVGQFAEPFSRREALKYLDEGRVVIFAAGTGHPFFTTDTAAALRAAEIGADAFLKGTKVDGVFDGDPVVDRGARLLKNLSYADVIGNDLRVMDHTSITLCMENRIPIIVFNVTRRGVIRDIIKGDIAGTIIS